MDYPFFAWSLAEADGDTGSDLVIGFDSSEDVIDISDLVTFDSDTPELDKYLDLSTVEDDTVLRISNSGDPDNAVDQIIVIDDVDLLAGFEDADAAIKSLLENGQLVID